MDIMRLSPDYRFACELAWLRRFAARLPGLAFGLALAVRPAGLAEVSRVNGAPQARPAQRDAKHR
jgi:hypothetical protein